MRLQTEEDENVETMTVCRCNRLCMCLVQLSATSQELLKCYSDIYKGEEEPPFLSAVTVVNNNNKGNLYSAYLPHGVKVQGALQ